jgi:hypothetical protein
MVDKTQHYRKWIKKMPIDGGPSIYVLRQMAAHWPEAMLFYKREDIIFKLDQVLVKLKATISREEIKRMDEFIRKSEKERDQEQKRKTNKRKKDEEDVFTLEFLTQVLTDYQHLIDAWGIPIEELETSTTLAADAVQARFESLNHIVLNWNYGGPTSQQREIDNTQCPPESFPIFLTLPPLGDVVTLRVQPMRFAQLELQQNSLLVMKLLFKVVSSPDFKEGEDMVWITHRQLQLKVPTYWPVVFPLNGELDINHHKHECVFRLPRGQVNSTCQDSPRYRQSQDLNLSSSFHVDIRHKTNISIPSTYSVISINHTKLFQHLAHAQHAQQELGLAEQVGRELSAFHMPRELLRLIQSYVFDENMAQGVVDLNLDHLIYRIRRVLDDGREITPFNLLHWDSNRDDEDANADEDVEQPFKKIKAS